MKIYFAGSIRGGRNDKEVYFEIIKMMQKYGQVLTEHIGNVNLPEMGEGVLNNLTDEEIFIRDCNWVKEADILVAEITTPSLGVGYEIGFAESHKKPVLCLYKETPGKRTSAMICGNKYVNLKTYNDFSEIEPAFVEFLKKFNLR
jgi:nucleoside 2-deoxyribosyltransferase